MKTLLNKKEVELKDLENSQPIHMAKNESVWKRTPKVWLNSHLIEIHVSVKHGRSQPHQQKHGQC